MSDEPRSQGAFSPAVPERHQQNDTTGTDMEILARRLTIITLLMGIFAILLTAAVESDARRQGITRGDVSAACQILQSCRKSY